MNLPRDFIQQMRALTGNETYERLEVALQEPPVTSVRMNACKPAPFSLAGTEEVLWCRSGYYLDSRPAFTFDPLFHAGCYYVQEASSMFLEQAIRKYVTRPSVVLDLCAAPGGKSTHLCSLLAGESLLVANEVIRSRSQVLAENLIKWGHPNVAVTNNDPAEFSHLHHFFDVILADVPCSGEGMFRKDAGAVNEWSLAGIDICRRRQRRIIADVWQALKPGGLLIYSTCTYNTKENEENIAWIAEQFGAGVLPLDIPSAWRVTGNLLNNDFPVYRFLPYETKGEGFFLAVLRKPEGEVIQPKFRITDKKNAAIRFPEDWITAPQNYLYTLNGSLITAVPKHFAGEIAELQKKLRAVHCGITLGEIKGKDVIPSHALAMSLALNQSAFPVWELSYEQAIAYLRREAIVPPATLPRGYVLLAYQNVPLGFAKNIGNRANNLYPGEWRIRSSYGCRTT